MSNVNNKQKFKKQRDIVDAVKPFLGDLRYVPDLDPSEIEEVAQELEKAVRELYDLSDLCQKYPDSWSLDKDFVETNDGVGGVSYDGI